MLSRLMRGTQAACGVALVVGCVGVDAPQPAPSSLEAAPPQSPTKASADVSQDSARPASRPSPGPIQSGECPLAIVPGRALGPIQLGSSRAQLEATGLPVASESTSEDTEFVRVGPYLARLCGGWVAEAWIDDLRLAPDCVFVDDEPVALRIPREEFIARFDACTELPGRIGGAFTECAAGGVRIGYGMGEFVQVRVGIAGIDIDDDCSHVLDDGAPVDLEAPVLAQMLEETVDLRELSPYWHPEQPGRQPLRIVTNGLIPELPAFKKFGSPVVYVAAGQGGRLQAPYFEVTKLRATKTTAVLEFRYAAEGLAGSTSFRQRYAQWTMTAHEVVER